MAGIESHYSINVAKQDGLHGAGRPRYVHYCRIELSRSLLEPAALDMLDDMRARFPSPLFKVELTYWSCSGRSVDRHDRD